MIRQSSHLCIPEVEFEALISGVVKDSIQTFSKLTGFASDDACLPTQYLRIVSIMYDQLDAANIPSGLLPGVDFPSGNLDIPFACLIGLGVTLPIWLNHNDLWQQLAKGLSTHWHNIRRWLLFLYRNVIIKEGLDMHFRYTCKSAVLQFLGLIRDRLLMSWSKSITTDREMMRMICDLWFIEARDPRFSSWSPKGNTHRESAVFNSCFLIAHEMGTTIDWDNLLSLFQKEPEVIATVSLCHLDREFSRESNLDLNCVAWDLHIITAISFQHGIRLALLRQGMMKAAGEIFGFMVDRHWEGDTRILAARCMINAIVILTTRVQDLDGLPFLLQAINQGVVTSLLKCEKLLPFTQQPLAHCQPVILLGILLGYTVYRSILLPVALDVDLAIAQRLEVRLTKGGEIYKAWKKLKDAVGERRALVRRDVANGHIQTCQNEECSRAGPMNRFKRCAGCLHAYYCSRKCQRYDWLNGKHKQYCARIHQRFVETNGQMSRVHCKDIKFLDQVILVELKKYRSRLSAHSSKIIIVEFNFVGGQTNAVFDAHGTNANPFGTKCECEIFANTRWKHMAEVAREGKRSLVLVRAFIPGGWSRKIVLQAIPLSVVMEGGKGERRKGQMVEKYQFNLIYTCCGSEGRDLKPPRGLK